MTSKSHTQPSIDKLDRQNTAKSIPVRHMQFKFPDNFPKYFAFNNPAATSLFVVFSAIFPAGERFFVESLRNLRSEVKNDQLQQHIKGFIGQEAMHAREHERFNQCLRNMGFNVDTPERYINHALNILRMLPPQQQLACTVAMEHFTAQLATQWLSHDLLAALSDQQTLTIWQWHALEELEHKAVSFDVYQQVCNDPLINRYVAFIATHFIIIPAALAAWIVVAYQDKCLRDRKRLWEGLKLIFGKQGFLTPLWPRLTDFLSKDFDPRTDDTQQLEAHWHEQLLGRNGLLNNIYYNKPA